MSTEPQFDSLPLGIDADTGLPLDAIDAGALEFFTANDQDQAAKDQMAKKADPDTARVPHMGTSAEVKPGDLHSAGWAVMFAPGVSAEIREALQPLLDHRRKEVGDERLFKIFEGADCCQANQKAVDWLAARGVSYDVVDPLNGVPYYVTLVGPPEEISFEFQYGLDLYWAVGRLWFPTVAEFRNYAESVIHYETMASPPTSRQLAIFAPRHDLATELVHDKLAIPISDPTARPVGQADNYQLRRFLGADATKDALREIYCGSIKGGPPALLFTGSHGMRYNSGDNRQETTQGAIVCQDWPGTGGTNPKQYFQASDLAEMGSAKVHGLVQLTLACYGGGVPEFDNFDRKSKTPARVAPKPMLARLPQTLLGLEGGALAVLAHVERAWTGTFRLGDRSQAQGYRDAITLILQGTRVGHATDSFNMKWAAHSTTLAEMLQNARDGFDVDQAALAEQWKKRDDARNFVVLGDPAVRLRAGEMPAMSNRPT